MIRHCGMNNRFNEAYYSALQKECLNILMQECHFNSTNEKLSPTLRYKMERLHPKLRKAIVMSYHKGWTPFFMAITRNYYFGLMYMLEFCNVSVEEKGIYQFEGSLKYVTPLWCAAIEGNVSASRLLISWGANVNEALECGSTPLDAACRASHINVAKFLIAKGANVNTKDNEGNTCLMRSVHNIDLCKYLLNQNADINVKNAEGKTAINFAINRRNYDVFKLLLNHEKNCTNIHDLLTVSCLKKDYDTFQFLIQKLHDYSCEEIANGYELLGTTYVEHGEIIRAGVLWTCAQNIRDKNAEGPIAKAKTKEVKCFHYQKEYQTADELKALLKKSCDDIKIHSLIIAERILGCNHEEFIKRMMNHAEKYLKNKQIIYALNVLIRVLEIRVQRDTILCEETATATEDIVQHLEQHLQKLKCPDNRMELLECTVAVLQLLCNDVTNARDLLKIRPVFLKQLQYYDKIMNCFKRLHILLSEINGEGEKKTICERFFEFEICEYNNVKYNVLQIISSLLSIRSCTEKDICNELVFEIL